ncbi:Uma2 family endonuclease [Runella sp.]|jgi:Uma2 family endonuclease|uniref:Uma2 family endonuclease n=2 Tax=Runella sp. TaxID=1960881 RepID=UPI00301897D3
MKKEQLYIYELLTRLFISKGYWENGMLVAEQEVILTDNTVLRPDIAYFTREQIQKSRNGTVIIPEFIIEITSNGDLIFPLEKKITEYFKAGAGGVPLKVIWNIIPEQEVVYVYTSRRDVKICLENDICSAKPVLPDFEKCSSYFYR